MITLDDDFPDLEADARLLLHMLLQDTLAFKDRHQNLGGTVSVIAATHALRKIVCSVVSEVQDDQTCLDIAVFLGNSLADMLIIRPSGKPQ